MTKVIKNIILIGVVLMLATLTLQVGTSSSGTTGIGILGFNANLHVPTAKAAPKCKSEPGGVCEKYSEWFTNRCNVSEGSSIDSYPCEN